MGSESKHTPGPWHVGQGGNRHANRVWTLDMRPVVNLCSIGMGPADIDPEAQANARLIAAAPDLFEALQQCLGSLRALGAENGHAAEAARTALSRATGGVDAG